MQRPFILMAKPSSSQCNLKCQYCFYLDKELSTKTSMDDAVLQAYIQQYIATSPTNDVEFIFQGGEPTLCSLSFYQKVVDLQKQYQGGKRIHNSIQTNGILIDEAWAKFLKEHDFLVGISVDGPAALHDTNRLSRGLKPTHAKVMQGLALLKQYQVRFNTLTVVNSANVHYGKSVFEYLCEIGSNYLQFIPLTGGQACDSVSAEELGSFWCEVIDAWLAKLKNYLAKSAQAGLKQTALEALEQVPMVQFIEQFLIIAIGGRMPNLCINQMQCGNQMVLEQNGDVYSCDHFVEPEYKLGNILESDLRALINSPRQVQFSLAKAQYPEECYQCRYLQLCNGGCPAHRKVDNEGKAHNVLCAAYLQTFKKLETEVLAVLLKEE